MLFQSIGTRSKCECESSFRDLCSQRRNVNRIRYLHLTFLREKQNFVSYSYSTYICNFFFRWQKNFTSKSLRHKTRISSSGIYYVFEFFFFFFLIKENVYKEYYQSRRTLFCPKMYPWRMIIQCYKRCRSCL